jgi:hypothetical protein
MRANDKLTDPLKEASLRALGRVTESLIALMIDTGVTVQEYGKLVRERAVHTAAARLLQEEGHASKTRLSILTGLSRAEVARILKANGAAYLEPAVRSPVRRVLAAWHDNPRFVTETGDPAVLPIFGKGRSFERLVARSTRGIPVRAMLDELAQIKAVEMLPGLKVKAKTRIPVHMGLNRTAVSDLGERAEDLLKTLRTNLRSSDPLFEGTTFTTDIPLDALPLVRRELAEQGASFIESANSLLNRFKPKRGARQTRHQRMYRMGVTAYCFQDEIGLDNEVRDPSSFRRRKNLRRRS